MTIRSAPERLDRAVDALLAGEPTAVEPELRPMTRAAARLAAALRPLPVSAQFEERLSGRLAHESVARRAAEALTGFTRRELAHPGRLLAAGAVSSAAVGVTVTAYAVWRSSRRQAGGPRLLHR